MEPEAVLVTELTELDTVPETVAAEAGQMSVMRERKMVAREAVPAVAEAVVEPEAMVLVVLLEGPAKLVVKVK